VVENFEFFGVSYGYAHGDSFLNTDAYTSFKYCRPLFLDSLKPPVKSDLELLVWGKNDREIKMSKFWNLLVSLMGTPMDTHS
jgi:hypothetical protein